MQISKPMYEIQKQYHFRNDRVNPFTFLNTGKLATFADGKDPDEMPHDVAFHQSLHCLLRLNNL